MELLDQPTHTPPVLIPTDLYAHNCHIVSLKTWDQMHPYITEYGSRSYRLKKGLGTIGPICYVGLI